MHSLVNVTDLLSKTNKTGLSVHLLTTDYDTDDESESDEVKTNAWADMSSIKPLRAITITIVWISNTYFAVQYSSFIGCH